MMRVFTLFIYFFLLAACGAQSADQSSQDEAKKIILADHSDLSEASQLILSQADKLLQQPPVPITSASSERSAGGIHDFYSEGDYWWPNPDDPDGSYIQRDGQTNPDNFVAHRHAMRDLSKWVATLVAAYQLSGDEKYAKHALTHLRAFFLNPATLMNPNLLYAQAISGRVTGRGIGIIDTIHLIEVARAIEVLTELGYLEGDDLLGLKEWFHDYGTWMNTHEYGLAEKDHGNNHSTWWAAQLAAFASLTNDEQLMETARSQFKKLLSAQMEPSGTFPDELKRTKPYSYTLFNLEGYSTLAAIASTPEEDLWKYQGENGSLQRAWNYILPYLQNKASWPHTPDVQHFEEIPIQSVGMLLAAKAYEDGELLSVWKKLSPTRQSNEVDRTFPLRQPTLWVDDLATNQ